jgi:hypothetical protein
VGTAPIEAVQVRGMDGVLVERRTWAGLAPGARVKIMWSGAEVRGRNRLACWDGELRVEGSSILDVTPVNFWNPDALPVRKGASRLGWSSITTGGQAGLILTLARPGAATIHLATEQRSVRCRVTGLRGAGRTWDCGGVGKRLRVYRLPDAGLPMQLDEAVSLRRLPAGEQPVYVRIEQVDGHLAWTSPFYLRS